MVTFLRLLFSARSRVSLKAMYLAVNTEAVFSILIVFTRIIIYWACFTWIYEVVNFFIWIFTKFGVDTDRGSNERVILTIDIEVVIIGIYFVSKYH